MPRRLWIHKDPPSSVYARRKIVAKVVEIAINTLFTKFVYTFGSKLYLQQAGAPIGTRVACAAANLLMEWLWDRVEDICQDSGQEFSILAKANYVDDARVWLKAMKKGTQFKDGKFIWSKEQEDLESPETTREDVTYREVGKALNSIT